MKTSRAAELSVVNSVECGASQGKAAGQGRGGTIIIPSHQQPLKMPQVFVTRRETLSAAHRLHCVHLSDEENQELYGPCNNIHAHGHNYVIEVVGLLDICSLYHFLHIMEFMYCSIVLYHKYCSASYMQ